MSYLNARTTSRCHGRGSLTHTTLLSLTSLLTSLREIACCLVIYGAHKDRQKCRLISNCITLFQTFCTFLLMGDRWNWEKFPFSLPGHMIADILSACQPTNGGSAGNCHRWHPRLRWQCFVYPSFLLSSRIHLGLRQVCVRSSKQSAESRRLPVILCWLIFQMSQVKEFGMGEWELAKRIHFPTTTTQRFSSGRIYPVSLAKGMFHNRKNKMMEQMFVLNCFLTSH